MFDFDKVPEALRVAMDRALRLSGDNDPYAAHAAQRRLAKAFELPLRQAILSGDIVSGIFKRVPFAPGVTVEYPIDFLTPGVEDELVAYTIPNQGRIPEKTFEGDYVVIPTYAIAGSIDWNLKYARDARWDVIARYMQALEVQFVKKTNDDGWHTLLAAGVDRNILVYDASASAGQFTKRLVSLMKLVMRRNGGGNSASTNRQILTDLYISPEAHEDIRNWNVDQVDEQTRREIYISTDEQITRVFQVNLHTIDELGQNQEYQLYYTNQLSGTLGPNSDVELVVGINNAPGNTFVQPIRQDVQLFPDPVLHRAMRQGFYGWKEQGFGILDNRYLMLGSF